MELNQPPTRAKKKTLEVWYKRHGAIHGPWDKRHCRNCFEELLVGQACVNECVWALTCGQGGVLAIVLD